MSQVVLSAFIMMPLAWKSIFLLRHMDGKVSQGEEAMRSFYTHLICPEIYIVYQLTPQTKWSSHSLTSYWPVKR